MRQINKIKGCLMSINPNWHTPEWLYKELDEEFNFDCDPCPIPKEGELQKKDMLGSEWGDSNFINPPYKENDKWLKRGYEEFMRGKTCVFLIPSRTDTRYWHDYVMKATEIRFVKGRLKFGNAKNSAPFPSAIVIFNKKRTSKPKRRTKFKWT